MSAKENYPEIREAVAKLCARFPGECARGAIFDSADKVRPQTEQTPLA